MNPFKNTIALNKIRAGFRKYMKHMPAIRAAQAPVSYTHLQNKHTPMKMPALI